VKTTLQNTTDLTDLVISGRDKNEEENSFVHEYALKGLAFRAERSVPHFFSSKSRIP
jgi:signal recognition particle subunit SRP68